MTIPSADSDAAAAAGASRWTVAIFALIGLGIGLVAFQFKTQVYEAQSQVSVSNPVGPLEDEVDVVTGSTVIDAATAVLGVTPDISVSAAPVSGLLTITARSEDPEQAALTANTVATTYVAAQLGAAATITREAEIPPRPTGIGPLLFAAIGALIGALLGAIFGYVQQAQMARLRSIARSGSPGAPYEQDGIYSLVPAEARDAAASSLEHAYPDDPDPDFEPGRYAELAHDSPPAGHRVTPEPAAAEPVPPTAQQDPATSAAALPVAAAAPSTAAPTEVSARPMDRPTAASAFADASVSGMRSDEGFGLDKPPSDSDTSWLVDASEPAPATPGPVTVQGDELDALEQLDRRALQSQIDTVRYELTLAHDEEVAHLTAEHERQIADLRSEIGTLNKQVRIQAVRHKSQSGNDQTRVGDLEAQVDNLEIELAGLRQLLETERITHTKRITDERGAADRALDNARRQYRAELGKHLHTHRQVMTDHRAELDHELAADRAKQAEALEQQHADYEHQVEGERVRLEAKLVAANERHQLEVEKLKTAHRQDLDRQAAQHKETITELRGAGESSDVQLRDAEKENRALRVEITTLRNQARHNETEHATIAQRLNDEMVGLRAEIDAERERNGALRTDVLRRSAEAHQAIDRAVEERTAQLSELEASVSRQRDYADSRVREIAAAAEDQARQAAVREAELSATVSRLKREIKAYSDADQSTGDSVQM